MNNLLISENLKEGLGHKLRSPLNAIIGFTGTLLMKLAGPLTSEQERQLRMVQTSAHDLLRTINEITEESRPEEAVIPPFVEAGCRQRRATRILAVDDSPVNLYLIKSTLEPMGYLVDTAHDVTEALASATNNMPDLIISDVNMQRGSGFDFIETLKHDRSLKSVPFAFITSTYWNADYRTKGLALGATAWILRPIEPELLIDEIETCLKSKKED